MTVTDKELFGVLSVVLCLYNLSFYIRSIVRRKIRPHAFSWLLWTVSEGIVSIAQYLNSAGPGAWAGGIAAIFCGIIGVLSLFYGERHGTRGDWIAIILALSAIPLWIITKDALASVILLTLIDTLGYYPTFRKSHNLPYEESLPRPFFAMASFAACLFATEHYNLINVMYPATMGVIECFMSVMLLWRRNVIPRPPVQAPGE